MAKSLPKKRFSAPKVSRVKPDSKRSRAKPATREGKVVKSKKAALTTRGVVAPVMAKASPAGDRAVERKSPALTLPRPESEDGEAARANPEAPRRVQPKPVRGFPVVGIGASAGGLEAVESFLAHMPPDSDMAFVVITHMRPGSTSLLPQLLSRRTTMPVMQVTHEVELSPNHVYVAPPDSALEIEGYRLHLGEQPRPMPIDTFFRALAAELGEHAVGIVLSGTGSDGTLGLKEIKAASGMVMAQELASAKFEGMPASAIAAHVVDYVLAPDKMPEQLIAYKQGGAFLGAVSGRSDGSENPATMSRVFALLRGRTGHDFSWYKPNTIRRRIERRMNLRRIQSLREYVRYLQDNAHEIDALFDELLIGVTSFFRDRPAYDALEEAVRTLLLTNKSDGDVLRVWVAGCSTGEEAYSLAMLLIECIERSHMHLGIQMFATDLDEDAIATARKGIYLDSIRADVSPERLERFFVGEEGFFRVKKELRERIVFATQSLIEDPPFTKLDLLSCRNLLIYVNAELQQRLLPLFHYALKPGGLLFLGSSETTGGATELFHSIDKKWKIFARKETSGHLHPELRAPFALQSSHEPRPAGLQTRSAEPELGSLIERTLASELMPPSVLVNSRGDIIHLHGRTGMYLEPAQGAQGTANVLNMAREGLQVELAAVLRKAAGREGWVSRDGVRVRINDGYSFVDVRAKRLNEPERLRNTFLVTFISPSAAPRDGAKDARLKPGKHTARVSELERELQHLRESYQSTLEELESTNEELKSSNEEMQSTNEELQSANEELETGKEEMQSLNEELQTVNAELQTKIEDLSRVHDDMKNLLNGTDIATIFLDNDLNIKRFTDQAHKIVHLIPTDVGRPLGDLASKLVYGQLVEDAQAVLRTLVFKEVEIQSKAGSWYLTRILPYRTRDNVIDGLVLTFVDITTTKGSQEVERRLNAALARVSACVAGQDADLRFLWAYGALYGVKGPDLAGRTEADVLPPEEALRVLELKRRVLEGGVPLREELSLCIAGRTVIYELQLEPEPLARAGAPALVCTAIDVTAKRAHDASLAKAAREE